MISYTWADGPFLGSLVIPQGKLGIHFWGWASCSTCKASFTAEDGSSMLAWLVFGRLDVTPAFSVKENFSPFKAAAVTQFFFLL